MNPARHSAKVSVERRRSLWYRRVRPMFNDVSLVFQLEMGA